ncbi:aminopeptidase P family protein [Thermaurantiacus tibetensis]|uniref:aminopeptidase P family protein n=1 Tax=Thermaurantiacus tibetensis TaxID=2759035 RepID=UPI00188F2438|nr:aminopeptidase P family protein [Thermaurantiacus tibetensis]
MTDSPLARLRAELASRGLDGFLVPLTDAHLSEYVPAHARRLAWLTGFTGSAGQAVVLADRAALFVDGRYTLQAREEVDAGLFELCGVPATSPGAWLRANAPAGATIGYDPWLHGRREIETLRSAAPGLRFAPVETNPVDAVWAGKPPRPAGPAVPHALAFAGEAHGDKLARIGRAIAEAGAELGVLSALDSIAWAFNLRGTDVPRTPVVEAFALVAADGRATLFLAPEKVTDAVRAHLGEGVTLAPYAAFPEALSRLGGRRVLLDPAGTVAAVADALEAAGATLVPARDPAVLMKATKNPVEIAGARAAHRRDGLAVTRFLAWLDREVPQGGVDELLAEARLEAFRRESNLLRDLSFDSISAFGPNGAFPHYRSTPRTNRRLEGDGLYLIDSGGQYADGTTDITRTVAIGTPSAEMRDRFTRVLKGHIALATARFPKGTRGGQLDILARQHLWAAGLDYAHGTGHGVGSYLSVHEGPQRIAASASAPGIDEPLLPGMILSNEPGFYKVGGYGIRTENLVLVVEDPREGDVEPMLAFETLTLAPIDLRLVEPALLSPADVAWLDAYHARVREAHAPHLAGAELAWLEAATRPLLTGVRAAA